MRGEYLSKAKSRERIDGSSPRAWGIRDRTAFAPKVWRFIPTCVGNTIDVEISVFIESVHPHVRGEYGAAEVEIAVYRGSSPRAWGIHASLRRGANRVTVHPHVRGEYVETHVFVLYNDGSSPRAWGIQTANTRGLALCRFIPTCVGNTGSRSPLQPFRSVHPHVRGEYPSRKHEEFSKVIITAKIYRSGTA